MTVELKRRFLRKGIVLSPSQKVITESVKFIFFDSFVKNASYRIITFKKTNSSTTQVIDTREITVSQEP